MAQQSANEQGGRWLNATLFIEMVVASILGFVPLAVFLDTPFIPIIHAIGVGIITLLVIIKDPGMPQGSPRLGEWIVSGMSMLYLAAIASLYGFILYGLFFGGTKLVTLIVGWFGGEIAPNAHVIAVWPGAIIGILFGWGLIYPGFIALKNNLFSLQPGLRSPNFALVTDKRWIKRAIMWVIIILVISALIIVFFGWHPTPVSIAAELFLLFVFQAAALATRAQHSMSELYAIQAIAKLAYVSGLTKVVALPRIGDPEVDQLLSSVHLFAGNDTKAFVAEIITPHETTEPVTASEAVVLPIAAQVLAENLETASGQIPRVIPVLVLVGRKPTPSFWAFAENKGIQVVEIPDEKMVKEIIAMRDPDKLLQTANSLLNFTDNTAFTELQHKVVMT